VIDTAGLEEAVRQILSGRMTEQTMAAIGEADALLFVIDAREGVTAGDEIIAQNLRKSGKPVILAANNMKAAPSLWPTCMRWALASRWSFPPNMRWALTNWPRRWKFMRRCASRKKSRRRTRSYGKRRRRLRLHHQAAAPGAGGPAQCGQVFAVHRLLGDDRSIVGPEAGLTRDSITAPWKAGERDVLLHDTAGAAQERRG